MKIAFITGATGFLGSHLASLLKKEGYIVRCGRRHVSSLALFKRVSHRFGFASADFEWVDTDLQDTDSLIQAFHGSAVVFHCAGSINFSGNKWGALYQTNVMGTRNVVNACLAANVPTLIQASSVAAFGRSSTTNVITENTPWTESKYNSAYARSKYLAEIEVWRGKEEGLQVGFVNPGILLGRGDARSSGGQIIHYIKSGRWFYPIGRTGFVDVDDVARFMQLCYEKALFGKRYLLVGANVYYRDLLRKYAKLLGAKGPFIPLRGFILGALLFISKIAEFLHIPFPLPSSGLKSSSSDSVYHSVNLKDLPEFSFTPLEITIENSLKN